MVIKKGQRHYLTHNKCQVFQVAVVCMYHLDTLTGDLTSPGREWGGHGGEGRISGRLRKRELVHQDSGSGCGNGWPSLFFYLV